MVDDTLVQITLQVVKDTVGGAYFNPSIERKIVEEALRRHTEQQQNLEEVHPTENLWENDDDNDGYV